MTYTGTFLEVRLKMSIILCYVYRWFRETTLLNTTILLGGPGKIVKVDESLFRRKPKVKLSLIIILHFWNYIIFFLVPCWSPLYRKSGSSAWQTPLSHQHWGSCRLCQTEQLPLSSLFCNSMLPKDLSSIQTSGPVTTRWAIFQMYLPMEQSIIPWNL